MIIKRRNPPDLSKYGDVARGVKSTAVKYSGLDLSLTSTGAATLRYGRIRSGLIKPTTTKRGVYRLANLRDQIKNDHFRDQPLPKLIAIEGYSFGARNQREALGEWGGIFRLHLHDLGIPYVVVPATQLKKFATGSGSANKTEVIMALLKRWGVEQTQDDRADASVLSIIAGCVDDDHYYDLTQYQREIIKKIRDTAGL